MIVSQKSEATSFPRRWLFKGEIIMELQEPCYVLCLRHFEACKESSRAATSCVKRHCVAWSLMDPPALVSYWQSAVSGQLNCLLCSRPRTLACTSHRFSLLHLIPLLTTPNKSLFISAQCAFGHLNWLIKKIKHSLQCGSCNRKSTKVHNGEIFLLQDQQALASRPDNVRARTLSFKTSTEGDDPELLIYYKHCTPTPGRKQTASFLKKTQR